MVEQSTAGKAVGEMGIARKAMGKTWEPIDDLIGGTLRMREVGLRHRRHLPQFSKETDEGYRARVESSFLHNFYSDTVSRLICKPFSEPVAADRDRLPEHLRPLVDDMDMNGTPLQQFAQDSFWDAVNYGISFAVTDYTEVPENIEARQSGTMPDRRAETMRKARPRVIRISPPSYLGALTRRGEAGEMVLSQFRYADTRVEQDGAFGEREVQYVVVLAENYVQEWRKTEKDDEYIPQEPKPHTFGRVPVEVWYTNRQGYLFAKPPLLDLAWVTIDHWQSYSDQRNILHIARVPILFRKGVKINDRNSDGKTGGGFVLGAARVLTVESEKADCKYVEPSGGAITAGKDHLEMLERRADILGTDPLRTSGPATATGEMRAESKATCSLLSWIEAEEDFLVAVFRAAEAWTPKRGAIPEDWIVQIHKDFDLTARGIEEYRLIQEDAKMGRITAACCTSEGKRRGIYPDEFDPEREAKLSEMSLPQITPTEDEPPPDEEGEATAA